MNRYFITAVCSLLLFSSCHFWGKHIKGSGNVITDSRSFSNFTGVHVASAMDVYLKQDSSFSVKVEADDNLQQYIIVSESNGTLYIKQQDNTSLDETGKIKVYVSAPLFRDLKVSGASSLNGENLLSSNEELGIELSGASAAELELKAPKVSVEMEGASHISLTGETKDLKMNGSGASHAKCFQLLAENTDVDVSGASSADVFGSVKINATASGASHINCKGKGALTKNESGASGVDKLD